MTLKGKLRPEARLFKVACEQIARDGPSSVRVRDLCNLSGTSLSQFHRHYRSVNSLMERISQQGYDQLMRNVLVYTLRIGMDLPDAIRFSLRGVVDSLKGENGVVVAAAIRIAATNPASPGANRLKLLIAERLLVFVRADDSVKKEMALLLYGMFISKLCLMVDSFPECCSADYTTPEEGLVKLVSALTTQ